MLATHAVDTTAVAPQLLHHPSCTTAVVFSEHCFGEKLNPSTHFNFETTGAGIMNTNAESKAPAGKPAIEAGIRATWCAARCR
jgi:hypothetical protein